MKTKVISWDCESNGLLGRAFSIGAVLYENGIEKKTFLGRCPIEGEINPWVAENVLPELQKIKLTHQSYQEMLGDFSRFFLENKEGAEIIFHMGVPVEARVVLDMHRYGFLGPFDGAYPWLDIAGCLKQAGEDPTSVDCFNERHYIKVPCEEGGVHNPLYDARAAALCYFYLLQRK